MEGKVVLIVLCVVLIAASVCSAKELYVALDGNDANPGTREKPFATVEQAREAVRSLKQEGELPTGGVTVYLREGIYYLAQTLTFDQRDSGTQTAPVTYRAYDREQVWLSGGKPLDARAWQPVTDPAVLARIDPAARGQVLQADLAAVGVPPDVPELPDTFYGFRWPNPVLAELFCEGARMQLARWPNTGFAQFGEIVEPGEEYADANGPWRLPRFRFDNDRIARWHADTGYWMSGYWSQGYLSSCVRGGKVDLEQREIEMAYPINWGLSDRGGHRFFVFNLLEELDSPGEWFLDRKTNLLYFWPPSAGAEAHTVVSVLSEPLITMNSANYLTFRGIGFQEGRQNAVDMRDCSHNRLIACTIRNVGGEGVVITGGVDDGVQGCDIHDTGWGGIQLHGGDRLTLTPCNHFADNNHIYNTGISRRTHAGPIRLEGVGLRASHNLIHHEPHQAVWFNGNDIMMEYNEIYYVLTETTEGGVFYSGYDWTYRGNVIRYNYIHHINDSIPGCGSEAKVVHLDDCVAGTSFLGNLCYLCGDGVAMCGGPDNIADNNIFINCKTGVAIEGRGLEWWDWVKHPDGTVSAVDKRNGRQDESNQLLQNLERMPYTQPPWTKYPHLADILEREPAGAPYFCQSTRNIAFNGGSVTWMQDNIKPEWVTVKDNWDNEGDPGFVNAAKGDFHLRPDAPVIAKIGFEPLPIEQMGLVNDGTRASWPVHPEPPPVGFRPNWMIQQEQDKKQRLVVPSDLPVVAVPRISRPIVLDGSVSAQEWTQPQGRDTRAPLALAWNVDGSPTAWPSTAWVEMDDQHLYVAFDNDVDPATGVSSGHRWGQDDAVEIALAPVQGEQLGDTVVLRGFPDGSFASSDEAGAPEEIVIRAQEGTRYACKVLGRERWTAEWKIPLAALGLDPQEKQPRLLFNLSVRKPAGDLWVMWARGNSVATWEVREGGMLQLQPFSDAARATKSGCGD